MPSSSAASFCTQFDILSASISALRSISSSGTPDGGIFTSADVSRVPAVPGVAASPSRRSSEPMNWLSVIRIARSIEFSSSRMLPGQLYRSSIFCASGSSPSHFFFSSPPNFFTKNMASAMMSSLRSRSGGISTDTTLRR